MAREVEARLKISAVDRTAKAFAAVERRLKSVERQTSAFHRVQTHLAGTAGAAILGAAAPAALAYGAARTVQHFAAVERSVGRIGVTAGASAEETRAAFAVIDQAAYKYAVSQDAVTAGLDALVAAGRSLPEAMAFLPSIVATAQASGAEITDIATSADAVGRSFEITGDKMQDAFDILVEAGKLGKFELKDMAQYLPRLAPAFEALGYRGESGLKKIAASLQVVRDGTGSAGEAATAFQNVIQKMEANETAKRFSDFGIDLRKEMASARKEGKDLLDVFIDLSKEAIGGDMSKLPQLFADSEMQTGMRALINGVPRLAGYVRDLGNAAGSTQKDLDRILSDNQTKIDRLSASWDSLYRQIGAGVSTVAAPAMDAVTGYLSERDAVEAGWAKAMEGGVSSGNVQDEFVRRYKKINPDYDWYNLADRIAMTKSRDEALARLGRGELNSLYDAVDPMMIAGRAQRSPSKEDGEAASRALIERRKTAADLTPSDERAVYALARVGAEDAVRNNPANYSATSSRGMASRSDNPVMTPEAAAYWERKNAYLNDASGARNADILARIGQLVEDRSDLMAKVERERAGTAASARPLNLMADSRTAVAENQIGVIDEDIDRLRAAMEDGGSAAGTFIQQAGSQASADMGSAIQAMASLLTTAIQAGGADMVAKLQAALASGVRVNMPAGMPLANRAPATTMPNAGTPGG